LFFSPVTIIKESFRLAYRNVRLSFDSSLVLGQILFPVVYIFMAGFTYSVFLPRDTAIGGISYFLYLASGMAAFQAVWVPQIMGALVWEDKKNSMLVQLMTIMTGRISYIGGYLISSFIVILFSVGIVFVIYPPLISNSKFLESPFISFVLFLYSLLTLTIFFGCISFIVSIKAKTTQRFTLLNQGLYMVIGFLSPALFPIQQIPFKDVLSSIFYLNPLTYVIDIMRTSIFLLPVDKLIYNEIIALGMLSLISLTITAYMTIRMDFS
jgi:ABC-2 type transport system permease protein